MSRAPCWILVLSLLAACGGSPPAPIEDRSPRGNESVSTRYYTVQRGDTLYSIAFRYGVDYRTLAAANGIRAPYTIYPGQKLDLERQAPAPVAKSSASATPKPKPKPSTTPTPAPVTKPSHSTGTAKTSPPVTQPSSSPVKNNDDGWTGGAVKTWRWPAAGRVTRGYSSSVHKGIDIGGKRGDPVVAVADGKVAVSRFAACLCIRWYLALTKLLQPSSLGTSMPRSAHTPPVATESIWNKSLTVSRLYEVKAS